MTAARPGLPNVNSALRDDPDLAQELKEAVCDALVNAVDAKASGTGLFGEVVLGQRPRRSVRIRISPEPAVVDGRGRKQRHPAFQFMAPASSYATINPEPSRCSRTSRSTCACCPLGRIWKTTFWDCGQSPVFRLP